MSTKQDVVVGFRTNLGVKQALESYAKDDQRTVSWLVNKIVLAWLEAKMDGDIK